MGKIEYIPSNNYQDVPRSEEATLAALDWKKESDQGSFVSILPTPSETEIDRKDLVKLILIAVFALILITTLIYGLFKNFSDNAQLHTTKKGTAELTTKKGKTEANFQINQSFERQYRVYEVIVNNNNDPLNFFNATLIALPLSQAKTIFETDGSEIDAKLKAKHIPVIAENEECKQLLENYANYKSNYSSLVLSIKGDLLKRKEIYYKNKLTSISPQDFDDQEYLLISSVKEIGWQSSDGGGGK
jgi:hypothetical protein